MSDKPSPRWRPSTLTWLTAVIALVGLCAVLYPGVAGWLSSYNQSQVIRDYSKTSADVEPWAREQLALAHDYNDALTAGVRLDAGANIPTGEGTSSNATLTYRNILDAGAGVPMARVRIPAIQVDLPIYHGTSEDTLLMGAGHLEGSHLPVGGTNTHSVITAHRGLANATMFNDLDEVSVGDTFTVEVLDEVLSYRVMETRVVEPHDTDTLRVQVGRDVVTLVTCTPLGINSHRILVVGERITPTPPEDLALRGQAPDIPGFPWALVALGGGIVAVSLFLWRAGIADARARAVKQ